MKTIFKITFLATIIGWFPFMFICLWGMWQPYEVRLIICFSGLALCITSVMFFTFFVNNRGFWLRLDVLDKEIEAFRKAKESYKISERVLIKKTLELNNNQKPTSDLKREQIKEFVKRYMQSHEPDTFIPNKHGAYIYYSENGVSGINLEAFFEEILEDFVEENKIS
jgi:hypothetical protein